MIVDPVQALGLDTDGFPAIPKNPHHLPTPHTDLIVQEAGAKGHRTLWVVFVIMLIATIAFTGMSFSVPIGKRLYHIVTTLIVTTATLSYFAMAAGDGITWHSTIKRHSSHGHSYVTETKREVYWARYVDWAITTPLLLFDLALLAGMNGGSILIIIVADLIMILTGLFAAFGGSHESENSTSKWGWYAIACIAYLVVLWHLIVTGRSAVASKGNKVSAFFASIGGFTIVLWTIYPIVWGFADGSRRADVDAEIIAYAVLDVLAKPIFGLWLLLTHINLPETSVDISGFWAHGFGSEGAIRVGDDEEGA